MGVGAYCRSSRGKNRHTRTYFDLEENMPLFIVRVEAEFPTRDLKKLHGRFVLRFIVFKIKYFLFRKALLRGFRFRV
jgi:hypothetical protein